MLCSVCQGLFRGSRTDHTGRKDYHPTVSNLKHAANQGCWICVRVLETAQYLGVGDDCLPSEVTLGSQTWSSLKFSWPEGQNTAFDLQPMDNIDMPLMECTSDNSTGALGSWVFAENCIRTCLCDHEAGCTSLTKPTWYPTRLLDIRDAHTDGTVKLIHTREVTMPSEAKYITLSHCWGGQNILSLTKDTSNGLYSGIPLAKLPKTFVEAIMFARYLCAGFFWIDSLCIRQDSTDDWRKESADMNLVYENGYCSIAAAAASNSHEGLFRPRRPETLAPQYVRFEPSQLFQLYHPSLYKNLDREPLNTRGWVMQERILAPRVVSFGRRQIFFECRQKIVCEENLGGEPDPKRFHWRGSRMIFPPWGGGKVSYRMMNLRSLLRSECFATWWYLVEEYSTTGLSKKEDKLIAIAGMAKRVQQQYQNKYIAGIWERGIASHLAWVRVGRDKCTPPKTYQAPSWSWASMNTPVQNSLMLFGQPFEAKPEVTLIGSDIVPTSKDDLDAFGQLGYGSIRLRGIVYLVTVVGDARTGKKRRLSLAQHYDSVVTLDYSDDWPIPHEFYALPLLVTRSVNPTARLLLLRALTPAKGTFMRVGLAQVNSPLPVGATEREVDIPSEEYHGALEHTVIIV